MPVTCNFVQHPCGLFPYQAGGLAYLRRIIALSGALMLPGWWWDASPHPKFGWVPK
jgi:hypothetical protein